MKNNQNYRYIVYIYFKQNSGITDKITARIEEPVKTLKEALSYKSLIDDTVRNAFVLDKITDKVIVTWIE